MTQVIIPPVVVAGLPAGANPVSIRLDGVAGIATTEALATTLSIQRGDAAAVTGATTYGPTSGKTFRLMVAMFGGHSSGTAMVAVTARVRGLQSGTATVSSPIRFHVPLRLPTVTAVSGTALLPVVLDAGPIGLIDVPSGGTLAVGHVAGAASYVLDVALIGYEF